MAEPKAHPQKCEQVAEDGEDRGVTEQAALDSLPECCKAAKDEVSAGRQHIISNPFSDLDKNSSGQHSHSDQDPVLQSGAVSAQNFREHTAVVSTPNEDDAFVTATVSLALSGTQTGSSPCLALPVNVDPDSAMLSSPSQKQGFQDSASAIPVGTAVAQNIRRPQSFVSRSSVLAKSAGSLDQPADSGPRNVCSAAGFKYKVTKKCYTSASAASSTSVSSSTASAADGAFQRAASAFLPVSSASDHDYTAAPGNQREWHQSGTSPDKHLGGAALFGNQTRERQEVAEHIAHMRNVNAVARDDRLNPLERELGVRVRDADGAISLRRAREGWYNALF